MLYLTPDLAPKFRQCIPEFAALSIGDQAALAKMFWQCVISPAKVKGADSDLSAHIPAKKIRSIWGNIEKMKAVVGYKFFSCEPGNNLAGRASLYTPCKEFAQAYRCYVLHAQDTRLLSASGNKFVRQKHGLVIASKTSENNRRHGLGQPCPSMPVNRDALSELLNEPTCPSCEQAALKLLCLSNSSESRGFIPMRYEQKPFGRLYDCHGVQSISRTVRSAALQGKFDYDIENCHISILAELSHRLHVCIPTIEYYLMQKDPCRRSLVADITSQTGRTIDVDSIKSAIISLVYGAKRSTSAYAGLADVISDDQQRQAFVNNPFVINLSGELDVCRSAIVDYWQTKEGWITNALGIRKKFSTDQKKRALSFILTGIESRALDAVLQRWGKDILLCMHDGWVMSDEVPVQEFESVILGATGYKLTVERSKITYQTTCKNCCALRSSQDIILNKQKLTQNSGDILITNGACGCGVGLVGSWDVKSWDGGLVISTRPRWNLPPDFRGVVQKVGRPPKRQTLPAKGNAS